MTIYNATMAAALARLKAGPALVKNTNVRRARQTIVPPEQCPAVRLIDGRDRALKNHGDCSTEREAEFTVRIIVAGNDDATIASAWTIAQTVLTRLSPLVTAYAAGVTVEAGDIQPDHELADADFYALDMDFSVRYVAGFWSLEAA